MNRRKISAGLIGIAALIALGHSSAPHAETASWNGTWTGAWGGQAATSVTFAGNKVTSYLYQGSAVPVSQSSVRGNTVTFGGPGYNIVIVRGDAKTANAEYKSTSGNVAGAVLTRQ